MREAWLDATDPAEQRRIAAESQRQAFVDMPYIPLGQYFLTTTYRRSLTGVLKGPPLFWNVACA
jgi:peptide/nickel transport system substrate-binding protein